MEIKLTKEQLVNLISDGTYGDDSIYMNTLKSERNLDEKFDEEYLEERCFEDRIADRLLAGGHAVFDMGDEDDGDDYRRMLTMDDFNKGMENAALIEPQHFADFINGNDDFITGYVLLQVIAYGEVVFG